MEEKENTGLQELKWLRFKQLKLFFSQFQRPEVPGQSVSRVGSFKESVWEVSIPGH